MGILKKLFGGNKDEIKPIQNAQLVEGDVFYTINKGKYNVYKLLRIDDEGSTLHVTGYKPVTHLPTLDRLADMEVFVQHFPIDSKGFTDPVFITNSPVTEEDLEGYYYYIGQMQEETEDEKVAIAYYHEALDLTDKGMHKEAIEAYTKAIEAVDFFFEAIDNRAFCKMDLGMWQEAIDDFNRSLSINPGSILAEFSIGECFLRLGNNNSAKEQFEKALVLDPQHQPSKDFLARVNQLFSGNV